MLNITPDTGQFLSILIRSAKARRVLEIGTSNGYATLWIADALHCTGGKVITIEISERKAIMARCNFNATGLSPHIDSRISDVRDFLKDQTDEYFDLVFLDAGRPQYTSYWKDVDRVLKKVCSLSITPYLLIRRSWSGFSALLNQLDTSLR